MEIFTAFLQAIGYCIGMTPIRNIITRKRYARNEELLRAIHPYLV